MREMPVLPPPSSPVQRVAFFGPMAAGKSYCANYLITAHGYTKVAFAAELKRLAATLFDVRGKDGDDRRILQQLGQKMREIDTDIWVKIALAHMPRYDPVVIDDLRYLNEAAALKANGFTLILVDTDDKIRQKRIKELYPNTPVDSASHSSEIEWKDIIPDYVVNGTDFSTNAKIKIILDQNSPVFQKVGFV